MSLLFLFNVYCLFFSGLFFFSFFFACQRHETTFIPDSSESRRFSWSSTNHVSCWDWSDWEQGKNSVEIEVFTVQNWAVLNISVFLSKISFLVFQLKTGFIMSCASSKSFLSIGQSPKRVRTTALLIFTKQINHVSLYISFRQIAKIRFRFLFSPGRLRYSGGPYAVLFDGRLLLDAGRGNLPLPVYCKGLQRWQQVKNVPWNFMG